MSADVCESCEQEICQCCDLCENPIDDCECATCVVCGNKDLRDNMKYSDYHYHDEFSCYECCMKCGGSKSSCDCCEYCRTAISDCECHSSFGSSYAPGWEKRGHLIHNIDNGAGYKHVWPELDTNLDPTVEAASFYLLEAISHGVPYLDGRISTMHSTYKEIARFIEMYGEDSALEAISASRKGPPNRNSSLLHLRQPSILAQESSRSSIPFGLILILPSLASLAIIRQLVVGFFSDRGIMLGLGGVRSTRS